MSETGMRVLPAMHEDSFVVYADILNALKADEMVWQNFSKQPELYRRIQSERCHPDTFRKRLEKFKDNTRQSILFGDWHDGGRLLDYKTNNI